MFRTRVKHFVFATTLFSQDILITENEDGDTSLKTEPELRISRQLTCDVNRGPPNACEDSQFLNKHK